MPRILANGFQGLFLDTLDSSLHLEQLDPSRYRGMAAAAAELIREIRRLRTGITLILNRAYSLLPEVDRDIDVAMGESVYTTYDFERKIYSRVPPSAYRQQVEWLRAAARRRSGLRIFTLDYWDPSDKEQIAHIYREERANCFSPYVTSIDLTHIVPEPGLPSDVARKMQKTSQKRAERLIWPR